jgi:hypothetical protein
MTDRYHPVLFSNATILLDPETLQVNVQTKHGPRLGTLFALFEGAGCTYSYSTDPITQDQLLTPDNVPIPGVLIILTRTTDFATSELDAIEAYVNAGGSLLHMTNHPDFTAIDAKLAERFGVTLASTFLGITDTAVTSFNTDNPVLATDNVQLVCAHDGCYMTVDENNPNNPVTLATFTVKELPGTPKALWNTEQLFALTLTPGSGKVAYVINSGWVGDYGTGVPAWGMIPYGNNLAFVTSMLGWLLNGNPPMEPVDYEVPR